MTAEPANNFTHWDEEQLRQHIQIQLERISSDNQMRDRLLQEELDRRFNTVHTYHWQDIKHIQQQMDQRFQGAEKAVAAALASAEKAVDKAEGASEKRFDSVNEFRKTLSDQTGSFITRDKYDGLEGRVNRIEGLNLGNQRKTQNGQAQLSIAVAAFSALASIIAIILVNVLH